jgi:hypothetical protein
VNNFFSAFTAVIRACHIVIPAEYHEGCDLAEMVTGWGRMPPQFPLPFKGYCACQELGHKTPMSIILQTVPLESSLGNWRDSQLGNT